MNRLLRYLLKYGYLTLLGICVCLVLGFGLAYLSIEFLPNVWLKVLGLSLGLGLAAIGGFSGRASALGLPPPFTRDPLGWRKAKQSYETHTKLDGAPEEQEKTVD